MKLRKSSASCSTLYRIQAWFTRVAGLAIGLASLGTGVAYAEDGQLQPGIVEEIVVTASKREEGLMDVAQSIQYLSGEELEGSGVQNLAEIVQLIPGVSLPSGVASTRRYNVRGTGAVRTNDSAVGFYIDGMPHYIVDLPFGPDTEVFDLESHSGAARAPGHPIRPRRAGRHNIDYHRPARPWTVSRARARRRFAHA